MALFWRPAPLPISQGRSHTARRRRVSVFCQIVCEYHMGDFPLSSRHSVPVPFGPHLGLPVTSLCSQIFISRPAALSCNFPVGLSRASVSPPGLQGEQKPRRECLGNCPLHFVASNCPNLGRAWRAPHLPQVARTGSRFRWAAFQRRPKRVAAQITACARPHPPGVLLPKLPGTHPDP